MAALEEEPHFDSSMSEDDCVLITYQVIFLWGRNNKISNIWLSIDWIEMDRNWIEMIECALKT